MLLGLLQPPNSSERPGVSHELPAVGEPANEDGVVVIEGEMNDRMEAMEEKLARMMWEIREMEERVAEVARMLAR
jgi:hypothetical protein